MMALSDLRYLQTVSMRQPIILSWLLRWDVAKENMIAVKRGCFSALP